MRCVALKAVLERQIYSLVQEGVTDFLSGMAEGVDLLAAEIVLSLRAEYPSIKLHCILPYRGQETEWFAASQARYPGDIPVTFSGFCILSPVLQKCKIPISYLRLFFWGIAV